MKIAIFSTRNRIRSLGILGNEVLERIDLHEVKPDTRRTAFTEFAHNIGSKRRLSITTRPVEKNILSILDVSRQIAANFQTVIKLFTRNEDAIGKWILIYAIHMEVLYHTFGLF